jgi:transposase
MKRVISNKYKEKIAKVVANKTPNETMQHIADKMNISISTVSRCVQQFKNTISPPVTKEKTPKQWQHTERLTAVLESYNLSEEEKNAYCRNKGIYPHHIEQWCKQLSDNKMDQQKLLNLENKRLKTENKLLLKKITQKDQALSEAATLLLLKKKVEGYI